MVVAESAIHTRAQGAAAELAGADAILVGSSLMQAADPGAKLRELVSRPLVKVCGLTREEDVAVAVEAGADLCGFILEPALAASGRRACSPSRTRCCRSRSSSARPRTTDADLVQLYPREEGKVRGRDGVLLRDGEQVATVVDLRGRRRIPTHLDRARERRGTARARGRARPGQRRARDRGDAPVGGRRELERSRRAPGVKDHARCGRSWGPHGDATATTAAGTSPRR